MAKGGNFLIIVGLGIGAYFLLAGKGGAAPAPGAGGQLPTTPPVSTPPATTPPATSPPVSSPPARQPTGTPPTATQKKYLQAADLDHNGKIDDEEMIKANRLWVDGRSGFGSQGDEFILAVTQAWVTGASYL